MLALLLGIGATAGWIAFDVVVSVVTYPLMPRCEWWALVGSGAVLVLLTIASEIMNYVEHQRDEARHTSEHVAIASGTLGVFDRLRELTQMTGQPDDRVIETATSKILSLEMQVNDLTTMFWRRLNERDIEMLRVLLGNFHHKTVRIVPEAQMDCRELAGDLNRAFTAAGWVRDDIGLNDTVREIIVTKAGMHILGKYQDPDQVGSKVLDILRAFAVGGIGYLAALPKDDPADVVILIGPKRGRGFVSLEMPK